MADGDQRILPVDPSNPFPLGRHHFHDPRNRQHRALTAPAVAAVPARTRQWNTTWLGDQEIVPVERPISGLARWPKGTCTTYAGVGVCRTQPNTARFVRGPWRFYDTELERILLYLEGQGVDPWDGSELVEPRYEGSSTDAPFRILRARGHIAGWKWLFGEAELREYVQHYGPAAVGTVWKRNMFYPRPDGSLDVSGEDVGGHAYRIIYYDRRRNRYKKAGSWGRSWGPLGGYAWIDAEDMAALLAADGEAVTVVPA
jgi:hypothetical protein